MASHRFQIDRKVNVASILSLGAFMVLQTIGMTVTITYGWTTMGNRVDVHGDRITTLERTAERTTFALVPMSERVIRMETKFDGMKETVDKIEALIRRAPRAD